MANKQKIHIPNNLVAIRNREECTQKELAEILGVTERQVCNYEIGESGSLPIDKAIFISKKWNYSLDYIYCNATTSEPRIPNCYPQYERNNFLVDIRDFLRIENQNILFTITNTFWKYIEEREKINSSFGSKREKKRRSAELSANYENEEENCIFWKCSIPIDKFISQIQIGEISSPFGIMNENPEKPSQEKIEEAREFLKIITNNPKEDDL